MVAHDENITIALSRDGFIRQQCISCTDCQPVNAFCQQDEIQPARELVGRRPLYLYWQVIPISLPI